MQSFPQKVFEIFGYEALKLINHNAIATYHYLVGSSDKILGQSGQPSRQAVVTTLHLQQAKRDD